MKALLIFLLMSVPAAAGERFCNENLPYNVERIPDGFAVVRISSADYCKATAGVDYICENREDYRLGFDVKGDELTLTYTDGQTARFERCD